MLVIGLTIIIAKILGILSLNWNAVIIIEFLLLIAAFFELKLIYKFIDRHTK